jgi:hypothetical protein
VRRHTNPHAPRRVPSQPLQLLLQAEQARVALIRVRPEDLLVRDPRATGLGQRLDDGAGVAGVGDGGHAGGPAVGQPTPCRREKGVGGTGGLGGAKPADPTGKVRLRRLAFEAGQLEVRVGVDQARTQQRVPEVLHRHRVRLGHEVVGSDGEDTAVRSDQQRAALDRRAIDRKDPPRLQPAGPHPSGEDSAPVRRRP